MTHATLSRNVTIFYHERRIYGDAISTLEVLTSKEDGKPYFQYRVNAGEAIRSYPITANTLLFIGNPKLYIYPDQRNNNWYVVSEKPCVINFEPPPRRGASLNILRPGQVIIRNDKKIYRYLGFGDLRDGTKTMRFHENDKKYLTNGDESNFSSFYHAYSDEMMNFDEIVTSSLINSIDL